MKCPYCSNEIPNNSKQCDICGVELTKEDRYGTSSITTTSKTIDKFGGVFFGLCGLFLIGFGVAWAVAVSKFVAFEFFPLYGFAAVGIGIFVYGATFILNAIDMITGDNKFDKISEVLSSAVSYIMLGGFAIFWFGILIMADYQILTHPEENGGMGTFYFTLIFWIVGIIVIGSNIIKNIRKKK